MSEFTIGEDDFLLDGAPHRVLSGALHYFRVHPDQWADRIHKARLMGLNTIETYVAWNAHAPTRGEWRTDGGLDLARFLDLVAAEGMHAIVRPGPYICAEWDNGGLPAWLFQDKNVGIRRHESSYLAALTEFLERVYEILAPRQLPFGGPVILVQIENEYGAYGSDKQYLEVLVRITRGSGIVVPLTTIDQPQPGMLANGSLPGLHMTGSFGSRVQERLATLREFQTSGPLMCMEFWDGWFDSWGEHHHTTSAADAAAELDTLLAAGGSVNIYMFHGGTNFGLTNGANDKGRYLPIVTSYDYDAPLDEAGNPTEKFYAFRDVIAKYAAVPTELPRPSSPVRVVESELTAVVPLFASDAAFTRRSEHVQPPTFDELGLYRGFLLYEAVLNGIGPGVLSFAEIRDRAWVYLDGDPVGVLSRENHETSIRLPRCSGRLMVLVEDQGRVNYGSRLGEHKGIVGPALLDGEPVEGWFVRALDIDAIPTIKPQPSEPAAGPLIARGSFDLEVQSDLFLDTSRWGKGLAWVNGFLLGRYWRRGPQQTLFVPAPVTRAGHNDLVVLELEVLGSSLINFRDAASLGPTEL